MGTLQQGRTGYHTVSAVVIGNALDWYDFTLYGYFAQTIGNLYFPAESSWTSLLSALAVFGAAYVVRPFGGIFLAHFVDRWGRRNILILVIALMTIGTAMIAFAPTYAAIGIAAPLIIVMSRLLQGFSAGGEFATATTFLVEQAPPHRRGLYGAWQLSGQGVAILLSGIAGSIAARSFTPEQFEAWGWRIPFIIGLAIGPVGYYLRLKLQETPVFVADLTARRSERAPLAEVLAHYKKHTLIGLGLVVGGSASLYVLFVFMPTYAVRVLGLSFEAGFLAPIIAGATLAISCPIMGYISDFVGRKPMLVLSTAGLLLAPYPCLIWLQHTPGVPQLVVVEFIFGLIFSIGGGPFNAALAAMFPVRLRATGLAVAYNFGVALFGGLAPLIVAWLIVWTGNSLAPSYYVAACVSVGLIAAISLPAELDARAPKKAG